MTSVVAGLVSSCLLARWSLQFENNADSHVIGAPTDAFWKSGAGGFCLYVIPSLDMVIYKLGGATVQVLRSMERKCHTVQRALDYLTSASMLLGRTSESVQLPISVF